MLIPPDAVRDAFREVLSVALGLVVDLLQLVGDAASDIFDRALDVGPSAADLVRIAVCHLGCLIARELCRLVIFGFGLFIPVTLLVKVCLGDVLTTVRDCLFRLFVLCFIILSLLLQSRDRCRLRGPEVVLVCLQGLVDPGRVSFDDSGREALVLFDRRIVVVVCFASCLDRLRGSPLLHLRIFQLIAELLQFACVFRRREACFLPFLSVQLIEARDLLCESCDFGVCIRQVVLCFDQRVLRIRDVDDRVIIVLCKIIKNRFRLALLDDRVDRIGQLPVLLDDRRDVFLLKSEGLGQLVLDECGPVFVFFDDLAVLVEVPVVLFRQILQVSVLCVVCLERLLFSLLALFVLCGEFLDLVDVLLHRGVDAVGLLHIIFVRVAGFLGCDRQGAERCYSETDGSHDRMRCENSEALGQQSDGARHFPDDRHDRADRRDDSGGLEDHLLLLVGESSPPADRFLEGVPDLGQDRSGELGEDPSDVRTEELDLVHRHLPVVYAVDGARESLLNGPGGALHGVRHVPEGDLTLLRRIIYRGSCLGSEEFDRLLRLLRFRRVAGHVHGKVAQDVVHRLSFFEGLLVRVLEALHDGRDVRAGDLDHPEEVRRFLRAHAHLLQRVRVAGHQIRELIDLDAGLLGDLVQGVQDLSGVLCFHTEGCHELLGPVDRVADACVVQLSKLYK